MRRASGDPGDRWTREDHHPRAGVGPPRRRDCDRRQAGGPFAGSEIPWQDGDPPGPRGRREGSVRPPSCPRRCGRRGKRDAAGAQHPDHGGLPRGRMLVRKAATGEKETDGFPLYSREIFLHDALAPPLVWDGSAFVEREPVSGEEDYAFPAPIGKRHVHLFRHEEVLTLPEHLGKPVGWVDYKHDIRPELVQAIHAFHALGLLDPHHTVKIGTTHIPFREAFLAAIPEPSTLIGPMGGALAIVVEIHGTKTDGSKGAVRASLTMEHREANRRRGTTAERFLTAAASATGVIMILPKRVPGKGDLAPE